MVGFVRACLFVLGLGPFMVSACVGLGLAWELVLGRPGLVRFVLVWLGLVRFVLFGCGPCLVLVCLRLVLVLVGFGFG